jgi:hypothetical protein
MSKEIFVPSNKCLFDKPFYKEDGKDFCQGALSLHHVLYTCEGGNGGTANLVPLCRRHQDWVHHKNVWGGENFDELIERKKNGKHHRK